MTIYIQAVDLKKEMDSNMKIAKKVEWKSVTPF
jgi:hypothetical protein